MTVKIIETVACLSLASYTLYYSQKRRKAKATGAKWYLGVTILILLGMVELWTFK